MIAPNVNKCCVKSCLFCRLPDRWRMRTARHPAPRCVSCKVWDHIKVLKASKVEDGLGCSRRVLFLSGEFSSLGPCSSTFSEIFVIDFLSGSGRQILATEGLGPRSKPSCALLICWDRTILVSKRPQEYLRTLGTWEALGASESHCAIPRTIHRKEGKNNDRPGEEYATIIILLVLVSVFHFSFWALWGLLMIFPCFPLRAGRQAHDGPFCFLSYFFLWRSQVHDHFGILYFW